VPATALTDQISPELVLVDPELAAIERPRERAIRVTADQVVPLGVPLVPREARRLRSAWLVALLGLSLLVSGFLVSVLLFRGPAGGGERPTVIQTVTAPTAADAGRRSRDLRVQTGSAG
jgi:hypothetical protein